MSPILMKIGRQIVYSKNKKYMFCPNLKKKKNEFSSRYSEKTVFFFENFYLKNHLTKKKKMFMLKCLRDQKNKKQKKIK